MKRRISAELPLASEIRLQKYGSPDLLAPDGDFVHANGTPKINLETTDLPILNVVEKNRVAVLIIVERGYLCQEYHTGSEQNTLKQWLQMKQIPSHDFPTLQRLIAGNFTGREEPLLLVPNKKHDHASLFVLRDFSVESKKITPANIAAFYEEYVRRSFFQETPK